MNKSYMAKSKKEIKVQEATLDQTHTPSNSYFDKIKSHIVPLGILFFIAILAYSNTAGHEYASDDQMVIYDNKFVTAGTDSLARILTSDAFEGFFGERGSQLISGGRYRPLTFITFALEWEFFGRNPTISHIINIISYAILCMLIYIFLTWLFPTRRDQASEQWSKLLNLPFIASLLYTLHPIHTEVVANIKGRDELYGFLFGIMTLIYFFIIFRGRWWEYIAIFFSFLFALLSKENAITFLAVIPLVAFIKRISIFSTQFMKPYSVVILPTIAYLVFRAISTEASLNAHTEEILNNPFVRANGSEKWGTILFSYIEYFKLLVFPSKLTHDYYFNQIPYRKLSDPIALISLLSILALLLWLANNYKKRNELVFAILFFIITFSIVSNALFTVGIIMNERFIFVPSLGFSIICAWVFLKMVKQRALLLIVLVVTLGLYFIKTYSRNFAWKNNYTLFSTDYYNSNNSAKVATAFGGTLLEKSNDYIKSDSVKAKIFIDSSIKVLEHSIRIYPENSQAWLLYGNALYAKTRDALQAIPIYRTCLGLRQNYFDALYNIGILHLNMKQEDSAEVYLRAALNASPTHKEVRETLGKIYAKSGRTQEALSLTSGNVSSLGELALEAKEGGNYQEAVSLAQQALAQNPSDANANFVVGICYGRFMNRLPEAIPYLEKAVKLSPENGYWLEDLAVAYGMTGQTQKTIPILEQVIQLRPNDPAGYQNLATSYNLLGDKKKASYYLELARQKSQP